MGESLDECEQQKGEVVPIAVVQIDNTHLLKSMI